MCGGTAWATAGLGVIAGLSPRVRGNRQRGKRGYGCRRSIPACAGEPTLTGMGGKERKVYPRVCGGTDFDIQALIDYQGLSPRVRGNPTEHPGSTQPERSIPACAGEPEFR